MELLLLVLSVQDTWAPKLRAGGSQEAPVLELSGTEKLVDGTIVSISAQQVLALRRTPNDVPAMIDKRLEKYDHKAQIYMLRAQVKEGAWKEEFQFNSGTLAPGFYQLILEFDPTAQKPVVIGQQARDLKSFNRATTALLASSKDESVWAGDLERVHQVLSRIKKEFDHAGELAAQDKLTRSTIKKTCNVVNEQVQLVLPYVDSSMVSRTIAQLSEMTFHLFHANEVDSNAEAKSDDKTPAQLGGETVQAFESAQLMFNGEAYLYMRTTLSGLRDGTWKAYQTASTSQDQKIWKQWKSGLTATRKGLGRAHERMMGYELAGWYKENAADEKAAHRSIPWALEALDKFTDACERRLEDPNAPDPEPLLKELNENLPPPPKPDQP